MEVTLKYAKHALCRIAKVKPILQGESMCMLLFLPETLEINNHRVISIYAALWLGLYVVYALWFPFVQRCQNGKRLYINIEFSA